jgi:hypothetical protein
VFPAHSGNAWRKINDGIMHSSRSVWLEAAY